MAVPAVSALASFEFTDIERIEVLRGPQGTLFGKNTTAGAIHIISREPTFTPESNSEVSFGPFNFFQAKRVFGLLLDDLLAARVSGQFTRRDGIVDNVVTGDELNALNNFALRRQLLFRANSDPKLRFIADASDQDAAYCTQGFLRVGQSRRNPARQFPALATAVIHVDSIAQRLQQRYLGLAVHRDQRLYRGQRQPGLSIPKRLGVRRVRAQPV